ncbi:sterol O-acyltransferase 1 [Latimeria chalumnae]|uniref:Sterol O-acyltransferase 1 n=1 Tax=Latimeria chalumnae TaxID=7897 RepID=H3AS23_LATCH|nr:PREDICTED: sterol O-acyltransferase 1 [Latimeria chalumnae]|eukprot:XP_006003185.2 PREDICTED: sterol O-acyltransferase 1 [Latimeria chalumnae]
MSDHMYPRSRRASSRTTTASKMDEGMQGGDGERIQNGRVDGSHIVIKKQLRLKAEQLKCTLMKEVDGQLKEFINDLVDESLVLESPPTTSMFPATYPENHSNQFRQRRSAPEQGKLFMSQRSLLDELFEVNHIRTIYHMFIALLIIFIISTLTVDFIDERRLVLEFDLLVYAFGKFPIVISTWLCMFVSTLTIPYVLFNQWASHHSTSMHKTFRTTTYGLLFVAFQTLGLGFGPAYTVLHYNLPPASRFIVILEQVRLIMKVHSFIRENFSRVVAVKEKNGLVPIPHLFQYLYFLFAPTLIYRDQYPRNPTIRWSYVATKFVQVLGCLFYAYYVFVRLCIPVFRNISQEPFNLRVLVLCIFNSILPGVLVLFLAFFAFLHCWLNAFAEMLRFADRMFYKDWWNSTSFANYYRTWNVVVHDWLYYYAYRDFLRFFSKRFRAVAMLLVFMVSAVVHEYALAICFGFFYPVLFCLFMCFGMLFNFILHDRREGPIWNIIMWTSLFLGQGVLLCLYSQEWYAQQHCPIEKPSFLDLIKPRSWTCRLQAP